MSWNCVLAWTAAANPNRLRVRVHCRWRVTPSRVLGLSSLGTRKFGIRAVESFLPFSKLPRKWVQHERSAPVGTPHHRLVSNAQTNLRASGPNVLPRLAFSGVFGFRVFLNLGLSFSLYFLLCVCTCSSRLAFLVARVSASVFGFCLFVRAPLYLFVFLGVF